MLTVKHVYAKCFLGCLWLRVFFLCVCLWQMELRHPRVSSRMRWLLLSPRARCPAAWHSVAVEPMDHAAGAHLYGRKRSTRVRMHTDAIFLQASWKSWFSFNEFYMIKVSYLALYHVSIICDTCLSVGSAVLCFLRHGKHWQQCSWDHLW